MLIITSYIILKYIIIKYVPYFLIFTLPKYQKIYLDIYYIHTYFFSSKINIKMCYGVINYRIYNASGKKVRIIRLRTTVCLIIFYHKICISEYHFVFEFSFFTNFMTQFKFSFLLKKFIYTIKNKSLS